jgi:hypothetical protein
MPLTRASVRGYGHAVGRDFVEQVESSRPHPEPSQRGRDHHGIARQAEAELDLDLVAGQVLGRRSTRAGASARARARMIDSPRPGDGPRPVIEKDAICSHRGDS